MTPHLGFQGDGLVVANRLKFMPRLPNILLDPGNDLFGLLTVTVRQHPPRRLRNVLTNKDDNNAENRTNKEANTPAPKLRDLRRVKEVNRGDRTEHDASPVGAIDGQVHPTAILGRNELIDGRVDR